jgi:4-diphosphocytidyl-2-C-methyl-D-erythritol kinase
MKNMEIKAPAKINLFLKILGKRDDGYHDIFSWFQAVSLFDYISFEPKQESNFELSIESSTPLPIDGNNLIIKAAELLFGKYNIRGGLKIHLKKNIPIAAGLGGGSSDAAATIFAINKLFELGLGVKDMRILGLKIGSDLPFFFSSGQAEITGRGETIKEILLPFDYHIVLISPPIMISTAESYTNLKLDLTISLPNIKFSYPRNFSELAGEIVNIGNDFEILHLKSYPELGRIKDALVKARAILTCLSGSGPTIFGLWENMPEREDLKQITRGDWQVFNVWPITLPAWD